MIFQNFIFLDSNSTSTTSNVLSNFNGVSLILEVTGTVTGVTVQGGANPNTSDWGNLAVIDNSSLSVITTGITVTGTYLIPISGLSRIRVINSGTAGEVTVFGRVIV